MSRTKPGSRPYKTSVAYNSAWRRLDNGPLPRGKVVHAIYADAEGNHRTACGFPVAPGAATRAHSALALTCSNCMSLVNDRPGDDGTVAAVVAVLGDVDLAIGATPQTTTTEPLIAGLMRRSDITANALRELAPVPSADIANFRKAARHLGACRAAAAAASSLSYVNDDDNAALVEVLTTDTASAQAWFDDARTRVVEAATKQL